MRRVFPTGQADLWDALTNPTRLPRWFLPISGSLEVGGRYELQGNASGTIEACVEPESFSVTWEYDGSTSWLAVNLLPVASGTELVLAHESPFDADFWKQFGPSATGIGWDLACLGLESHLVEGSRVDPAEQEAYLLTREGATFLVHCGEGWAAAAVEDGDDPAAAAAAAERTVAFYTPGDAGSASK